MFLRLPPFLAQRQHWSPLPLPSTRVVKVAFGPHYDSFLQLSLLLR